MFDGLIISNDYDNNSNDEIETQLEIDLHPCSFLRQPSEPCQPDRSRASGEEVPTHVLGQACDGLRDGLIPNKESGRLGEANVQGPIQATVISGTHVSTSCVSLVDCNAFHSLSHHTFDHFHLLNGIMSRSAQFVPTAHGDRDCLQHRSDQNCLQHPRSSSSSTTSSSSNLGPISASADADFDSLILQLWRRHVADLGSIGRTKRWGSPYWKCWYDDVCLDSFEDDLKHDQPDVSVADGIDTVRCGPVDRPVARSGSFRGGRGLDREVGTPKADHGGRHIGLRESVPRSEIIVPSTAATASSPIDSSEEVAERVGTQRDGVPEVADSFSCSVPPVAYVQRLDGTVSAAYCDCLPTVPRNAESFTYPPEMIATASRNFAKFWHVDVETVTVDVIARVGSSLGIEGWSDPELVVLSYDDIERERREREAAQSVPCWAFGSPGDSFDMTCNDDVNNHNSQVSRILTTLGASGAGRRAVIRAVAERQGIVDPGQLEELYNGNAKGALRVPKELRGTLSDMGLGELLAPVNLITVTETAEILVNSDAWKDVEFEVALDSGSVVHVCSIEDCPGYRVGESPGSRRGQEFLMGDGGTIPNLGQSQLNLSDDSIGRDIQSVFQIAAVTRPLMSVGRICDEGHSITFDAVMAVVKGADGSELCRFMRNAQWTLRC